MKVRAASGTVRMRGADGMRNSVHTGARGEIRTQAACGEEALPGAGQAARRAAHGTCGMPLQEKLDAVDEYCTGDSLYTVCLLYTSPALPGA